MFKIFPLTIALIIALCQPGMSKEYELFGINLAEATDEIIIKMMDRVDDNSFSSACRPRTRNGVIKLFCDFIEFEDETREYTIHKSLLVRCEAYQACGDASIINVVQDLEKRWDVKFTKRDDYSFEHKSEDTNWTISIWDNAILIQYYIFTDAYLKSRQPLPKRQPQFD